MRLVSPDVANYLPFIAKTAENEDPTTQVVPVTSGNLTRGAMASIEETSIQVWDAQKLAQLATPELSEEYFGAKRDGVKRDQRGDWVLANGRAILCALTPRGLEPKSKDAASAVSGSNTGPS